MINQAGFLHFSIDSIVYKGNDNQYAVHISQDLYGAENLGNNNIIDVSFSLITMKYTLHLFGFQASTVLLI